MRLAACGVQRGVCRAKTLVLAPQLVCTGRARRGVGAWGENVSHYSLGEREI